MTNQPPHNSDTPREPNRKPDSGISTKTQLRVDTDRTLYALSDSELRELESCSDNLAKDFCLLAGGVALPTMLNGWAIYETGSKLATANATLYTPGTNLILNLLVGLVALVFSLYFGIKWHRSKTSFSTLITRIKNKPLLGE